MSIQLVLATYPKLSILIGYVAIAGLAAWPTTFGDLTIGPEHYIEADSFYGSRAKEPSRAYADATPILLDYPRDVAIARSFRSGRPFFWNPWVAAGVPLFAEQSGAFFPLRIVFYLAPGPASYTLFRASRIVLAALGAFALARSRGRSRWASFVAGGLLELSGALLWMVPFAGTSSAFVVPWLLFGVNLLFGEQGSLAIGVTGAAIGAIMLGGHPGIAVTSLVAGAVAFLAALLGHIRLPSRMALACGRGLLALVVGLALGAVAIWPFAELASVGHSYKETGTALGLQQANISLSRMTWWVGAFGPTLVDAFRESSGRYPYTLTSLYGILTMFLALFSTLGGKIDLRLGAVALIGVGLSFAPPGLKWIANLPALRYVLSPYAAILIAVPVTQWAGSGIDLFRRIAGRILVERSRGGGTLELPARVVAIGGVLALLVGLARFLYGNLDPGQQSLIDAAFGVLHPPRGALPILGVSATILMVTLVFRRRPRVMELLLGAAAIVELGLYAGPHFSDLVSPAIRHGRPSTVARVARVVNDSHSRMASNSSIGNPQYNMLDGIPDLRVVAALVPQRYHDYMTLLNRGGSFFTFYLPGPPESPLLDLAAVRFSLLPDGTQSNLERMQGENGWGLFLNPDAVPRARLVYDVEAVDTPELAIDWLRARASGFTHISQTPLLRHAVVELGPSPLTRALPHSVPAPKDIGTATFLRDEPDDIAIVTETKDAAMLVLADTHYPGWRAQIDGGETRILPTDVLFRGVPIPPGKHVVTFGYRPSSMRGGLFLSLVGTVACLWLMFKRRSGRGARDRRAPDT